MTERNGQPPHDEFAERAFLGSAALENSVLDASDANPEWFYVSRNRMMLSLMLQLRSDGKPCDAITIFDQANTKGLLDEIGGADAIEEVLESVPNAHYADFYLDIVREKWKRRELQQRLIQAQQLAADPTRTIEEIVSSLDFDSALDSNKPKFQFYSADEFALLNLDREYFIPGVLAAGPVPSGLFGAFKTLKTSIAMDLLISIATKNRFLGYFPVERQARVAIMSGESGAFALQDLAKRVAKEKGWTFSEIKDRFYICPAVPNLGSHSDIAAVERFITDNEIELLAIDPTYLAMKNLRSDDAANIFSMGGFLDPLAKLGERTGCTPLIVHHNRKMQANPNEPAELSDIAWSGFAEWVGQWILISRREKYEADSNGEHRLWLNAGGRDGHSALIGIDITEGRSDSKDGRFWKVRVERAAQARVHSIEADQDRKEQERDARKLKQTSQDRNRIIEAMQALGKPETKTQIRDHAGINTGRFSPLFAEMIQNSEIIPCEITKGKRQFDGFKLNPDKPDTAGQNPDNSTCPGEGIGDGQDSIKESVRPVPIPPDPYREAGQNSHTIPVTLFNERGIDEPF